MNTQWKRIPASITAPRGFAAAGIFCDLKRLGTGKGSDKGPKRDLALLVSEVRASVAGLFTTNQICAAPVKVCLSRVRQGYTQAILANSGNANACTGKTGLRDAQRMTELVARRLALPVDDVLVCSTGRIGVPMPMDHLERGLGQVVSLLSPSAASGHHLAEAIMTSDTRPKEIAVEFRLGGRPVRIAGVCKGAGMIQPGLSPTGTRPATQAPHATMLCFLTTDAAIEPAALQSALTEAVALSFNRITVDGDMSTNDSVIALANGLADNPLITAAQVPRPSLGSRSAPSRPVPSKSRDFALFQAALNSVCLDLAKMIVRDGEGVSRLVTVRVQGALSFSEADAAARSVANSALVKTSWCGGDPNWGRILDALGYSSARIVEEKINLGYSLPGSAKISWALQHGQPTKTALATLGRLAAAREFDLHIHLNLGPAGAVIYAADLTEAYVEFNKGDISDPAAMGG